MLPLDVITKKPTGHSTEKAKSIARLQVMGVEGAVTEKATGDGSGGGSNYKRLRVMAVYGALTELAYGRQECSMEALKCHYARSNYWLLVSSCLVKSRSINKCL